MRSVLLVALLAGCPATQDVTLEDPDGDDCEDGSCPPADCELRPVAGDFELCAATDDDGYAVRLRYRGEGTIDLATSSVLVNGVSVEPTFDASRATLEVKASGLTPSKYSVLFRLRTATADLRPVFVPMWIGDDPRYAGFSWRDASVYQILTDRFLDGDPSNNLDNNAGDLARVDDVRSQWQGGDFAGITQKIRDGYFESMGVNALWISSPIINSHNSQPAVGLADTRRFSSYHSYHPIATGYTHLDDLGFATPIEPAFGTARELHELVEEAHARGIRIIPDFVANHVQREAPLYAQHPEWFFPYNACDNRWDEARIGCWFTTDMPDFDFGGNPAAVKSVVDHALWMIQEFNFDGFRADALKHMDDVFVRALKAAVIEEIETTVIDHASPDEASVFYMVGESLGGWARYHVREDMVQGQVDEGYYNQVKGALLTFALSVRQLSNFAVHNDTAYLEPAETFGGTGGYAGAVMGNFFGNHDQVRALTEAGGSHERLRLAQTFLMTSPINIPMLYQGDEIGIEGGIDPDNRRMMKFTGLTAPEQQSLANLRQAGTLRAAHPAMRRGRREHVVQEDWYWVFKLTHEDDEVYVAINRDNAKSWSPPAGFIDGLGNCANGIVPVLTTCIFVRP